MDIVSYIDNSVYGQDRLIVQPPLYAVLDGLSEENGDLAVSVLERMLGEEEPQNQEELKRTLYDAHLRLRGCAAMTTIAGVLREEDGFYCFSVGDSSTYASGELVHHLDNDLYPDGSINHSDLEQAIGWRYKLHEETLPLQQIILATDGVTNNIDLTKYSTKEEILAALKEAKRKNVGRVHKRFEHDDQAFILINP